MIKTIKAKAIVKVSTEMGYWCLAEIRGLNGKSHQIDPQCLTHTDPSCFYPFNIPLSM